VKLTYTDADTGESREVRSDEAALTYANRDEVNKEEPNSSVLEDAALLEAALAREEALKYDAVGDYASSAARLAQAANFTAAMAPASPAVAAEAAKLQEESAQAPEGLDAMKRKAMHYARSITQQNRKA
jgi:hypothetical protein